MKKGVLKFILLAGFAGLACDKDKKASSSEVSAAPSASAPIATASSSALAVASADTGPACDISKPGDCEKACLGGKVAACGNADALLRQPGAQDDPAKRAKLNEKGCELGDAKSCSRLGNQYDKGDGVPKDAAKTLALRESACSKGWGPACHLAAMHYWDPAADRPQDMPKAKELFERACSLGVKEACDTSSLAIVVEIEDVASAPAKWEGKQVYLKNVAVRRASPTSGVVLKPGGSPALDGIPSIIASDQDETRKKWLKLPTPIRGVTVKFVEAKVEKQMARDERARLVIVDVGEVIP